MKKPKIKSNLLDHLDFQSEGKVNKEESNIKDYLENVKVFKVKKSQEGNDKGEEK
ncbi:hypothetical protein [Flexithrix dorotheae]|uniref:hypothetical protein n=1 Tax=Flexithrix dorotheae TaxID=70993 RepID=UPI000380FC59|nr:hypothetical protein [Flexithrix dorotheae]